MAKSSKELYDELNDLLDEANAITMIAERDQGGEFTAEQQTEFDALMDEETGKVAAKRTEYEARLRLENQKASLKATGDAIRGNLIERPKTQGELVQAKGAMPNLVKVKTLRAFTGPDGAKTAWACGQWLRAISAKSRQQQDLEAETRCAANGIQISMQHIIGDPAKGGNLVPTPLSNAIINYRELSGVSRQIVDVRAMTADTLDIPKKTATLTVEYPGEATAITPSEQTWAQVALKTVKRAIFSKVSQELADDAIIAVMDDLAVEMGSDFAINEDRELITGDGTAGFGSVTGLVPALHANGTIPASGGTWGDITLADLVGLMAALPSKFRMGSAWLCSPAFYDSVMVNLLAAAGGNYIASLEAGAAGAGGGVGAIGRFLGYPVYVSDWMPTSTALSQVCALFGNFRAAAILGDRIGVRIATSSDFAFNEDVLSIRGTTRYDINVHEPGSAGGAGAYVGLQTAAA